MKKYMIIALIACISVAATMETYAQDDTDNTEQAGKKKKKKKKKSKKDKSTDSKKKKVKGKVSAAEFEEMKEQYKTQVKDLMEENGELKTELKTAEDNINEQVAKINMLEAQLSDPVVMNSIAMPEGVVFKVQLGAYQKLDISREFNTANEISSEKVDGKNKYMIGYFPSLEGAEAFSKNIKMLGIKDAWAVPYLDGQRISDKRAEEILGYPIRNK